MASVMAAASRRLLLVLALGLCVEVATSSSVVAKSDKDREEGDVSIRQADTEIARIPWGLVTDADSCDNATAQPGSSGYCRCTTTKSSLNATCVANSTGELFLRSEIPSWGYHNIFCHQGLGIKIAKTYYCQDGTRACEIEEPCVCNEGQAGAAVSSLYAIDNSCNTCAPARMVLTATTVDASTCQCSAETRRCWQGMSNSASQ